MDDTFDSSQNALAPDTIMDENPPTTDKEREMAELLITMDKYTPIVTHIPYKCRSALL
jgi:hypothetical protein